MNEDLEAVTFKVIFGYANTSGRVFAIALDSDNNPELSSPPSPSRVEALLTLYSIMTEFYHSFRLQVTEGEKLVQELIYREAH